MAWLADDDQRDRMIDPVVDASVGGLAKAVSRAKVG
jgi:hypothetical protein